MWTNAFKSHLKDIGRAGGEIRAKGLIIHHVQFSSGKLPSKSRRPDTKKERKKSHNARQKPRKVSAHCVLSLGTASRFSCVHKSLRVEDRCCIIVLK